MAAEISVPGVILHGDTYTAPVGSVLVGARYGLRDDVELRLRLNTFPLVKGIVGVEGGGVYHVRPASGLDPGLHVTSDLSLLTNPRFYGRGLGASTRGALDVAGLADIAPTPWVRPYVVVDQAVILANGQYVLSLFVGAQFVLGRFELSIETGVADVNERTRSHTQPYVGLAGQGALAISWGLAYRFDDRDQEVGP